MWSLNSQLSVADLVSQLSVADLVSKLSVADLVSKLSLADLVCQLSLADLVSQLTVTDQVHLTLYCISHVWLQTISFLRKIKIIIYFDVTFGSFHGTT